jgi:response regulator RpfG family c-di-GMP phosphodiesterase
MEISRRAAREALKNIQRIIVSLLKTVPPGLQDSLDRLAGEVQALAVLCNRSLYLAHNFSSRLETQQERLSQQESEQLALSEAALANYRNIARSMKARLIFDYASSKRVAKYALAIAQVLGMPEIERRTLYHTALFKDISLAFARPETIEQMAQVNRETAVALKERLNTIWKTLATIPFFAPACNLLLYRFERYDGTGGTFGLKNTDIPLGTRVLAVADNLDSLISGGTQRDKIDPGRAIEQIVAQSGLSFDPQVVGALLILWERHGPGLVASENKPELDVISKINA